MGRKHCSAGDLAEQARSDHGPDQDHGNPNSPGQSSGDRGLEGSGAETETPKRSSS